MAANPEFNNCRKLIKFYLRQEKINWAKEVKIAKKLLQSYPIDFFESYSPNTSFESLSVFLTKAGERELENQFAIYKNTTPKPPVKLEETAQVEINFEPEIKQPKTILEFIESK